jgi:hypothetical protein
MREKKLTNTVRAAVDAVEHDDAGHGDQRSEIDAEPRAGSSRVAAAARAVIDAVAGNPRSRVRARKVCGVGDNVVAVAVKGHDLEKVQRCRACLCQVDVPYQCHCAEDSDDDDDDDEDVYMMVSAMVRRLCEVRKGALARKALVKRDMTQGFSFGAGKARTQSSGKMRWRKMCVRRCRRACVRRVNVCERVRLSAVYAGDLQRTGTQMATKEGSTDREARCHKCCVAYDRTSWKMTKKASNLASWLETPRPISVGDGQPPSGK